MKNCNHCQKGSQDEARFCGHCGQPLSTKAALEGRTELDKWREWTGIIWAVLLIMHLTGEFGPLDRLDWIVLIGIPVLLIGEWLTRVLIRKQGYRRA
ncbi:MAG: zinc ribbon domain-containing protein [Deltaproteobacteria bacterium]|nr:zinc ribbon domain-containing protein [Deltaproteobacteria bacterium]